MDAVPELFAKDATNLQHEGSDIIAEFGDLNIECVRVGYIEAMIFGRVVPGGNTYSEGLESAFMRLPRGTMNKVIATRGELYKTFRQNAAFLLEGMETRDTTQRAPETLDASF